MDPTVDALDVVEALDRSRRLYSATTAAANALGDAYLRCEDTKALIETISDESEPANYYVCRILAERALSDQDRADLALRVT